MSTSSAATPDVYFESMWATGTDPWDHSGRFYEHRKYALTAAMLRSSRYESVFEPGCATGILTAMVAPRADRYLANRPSSARGRGDPGAYSRVLEGIRVEQGQIPDDWPDDRFDAVILSEVLYYLEPAAVEDALERAAATTAVGADLVAVHYRPHVWDHALRGDEVHALISEHPAWARCARHFEDQFVLEGFVRR